MPAVGVHVRLRGREGIVSGASLGTMKRERDELVSSGAWVEVMLNDGRSAADHLRLYEDEWDEMEILDYRRVAQRLAGRGRERTEPSSILVRPVAPFVALPPDNGQQIGLSRLFGPPPATAFQARNCN
jgi:hypothetical protein